MEPIVLASARKHGLADDDILHAYATPYGSSCSTSSRCSSALTAPARPLEVGTTTAEGVEFVVHAMPARPKYLR